MSNDADPPPTWDDLKQLVRWFVSLFGDPKRLLEDQVVRKPDGYTIRGWLAGLEAIARALLLEMAAALPKPAEPPRTRKARKPGKSRDRIGDDIIVGVFDAPDSERWADVSFVLLPRAPQKWKTRAQSGKLPSSLMRTRPLAFRFEALLRVVQRPERYAARLARRLHAAPMLTNRVLREPRPIHCRSFPGADVSDALRQARRSSRVFKPGSG